MPVRPSRVAPGRRSAATASNVYVARLMRDNQLLSPFRRPPRPANDHDGTILTDAPDLLWGTDATLVQTSEEGRVWVFAAIDHFNSEVLGHHVSTDGSRFSALEPISQ